MLIERNGGGEGCWRSWMVLTVVWVEVEMEMEMEMEMEVEMEVVRGWY